MNNVRNYTDKELLDRVRSLPSFRGIPQNYWLIGVRSNEDAYNHFDDKFYLFKGEKFIAAGPGTTNAGSDLLHPSNPRGEAVLKADGIYYDGWERRLHRGKVMAYCQRIPLPLHRDNDRDTHTEELGAAHNEIVGINIHPASYIFGRRIEREIIAGWSQGCQVWAIRDDFDDFMKVTEGQHLLTYCLLKEFTPTAEPVLEIPQIQKTRGPAEAGTQNDTAAEPVLEIPSVKPLEEAADEPAEKAADPAQPPTAESAPVEQHAENITNVGIPGHIDAGLAKVDAVGNRFQAFQGVLDKFGFSNPDAKTSMGTVLMVVGKMILAPVIFVWGLYRDHPEYAVPVSIVLIIAAVVLWDRSKGRVAQAKEGMPKELAEKIVEKK